MLVDLTVKEFLNKVAGSDPVPGGGSIAALNGAVASALAAMVANLTIGKKNYEEHEELMNHIASLALREKDVFIADIDRDSEAYDAVFACFKMPKATDEEKAARSAAIQEATKYAALVPMQVALNKPEDMRGLFRCLLIPAALALIDQSHAPTALPRHLNALTTVSYYSR